MHRTGISALTSRRGLRPAGRCKLPPMIGTCRCYFFSVPLSSQPLRE